MENDGNHPDNPPVSVEVVGDMTARTGQNFKGKSIEVIPLPAGPILSYAEYFTIDEDYPYIERGNGCDCPKEETKMVIAYSGPSDPPIPILFDPPIPEYLTPPFRSV